MSVKMKSRAVRAPRALQRGSMMIEVLVSVVLLSISVLGLVRILGQSVKDSGELEYRSAASTSADQLIGRMWVDQDNLASYVTATPEAIADLPNGTRTVAVNGNIVTVTINWQAPGASASQYQMSASLTRNTP
jgi:type IV pilus assembly protein PilV